MDKEAYSLIKVTKSKIQEWFKPWKKALVVKLVGKNLDIGIIIKQNKYLWKIKGDIYLTDIRNGYIIVHLSSNLDYETALFGGPWLISNHYLLV